MVFKKVTKPTDLYRRNIVCGCVYNFCLWCEGEEVHTVAVLIVSMRDNNNNPGRVSKFRECTLVTHTRTHRKIDERGVFVQILEGKKVLNNRKENGGNETNADNKINNRS